MKRGQRTLPAGHVRQAGSGHRPPDREATCTAALRRIHGVVGVEVGHGEPDDIRMGWEVRVPAAGTEPDLDRKTSRWQERQFRGTPGMPRKSSTFRSSQRGTRSFHNDLSVNTSRAGLDVLDVG